MRYFLHIEWQCFATFGGKEKNFQQDASTYTDMHHRYAVSFDFFKVEKLDLYSAP